MKSENKKMNSSDVILLQQTLNGLSYNCGVIDGIYGKNTEAAVKRFQTDIKLIVDGICGNITWNALFTEVKNVQAKLNALGFNCGEVDGLFGSNTKNALIQFQKSKKLNETGICDADTKARLSESNILPTELILDVPLISQLPELPTGCEITSITMMLRYYGVNISKIDLANEMPKNVQDPNLGFVGDPFTNSGWTIYPLALMNLVKKYAGSSINLTGSTVSGLEGQILSKKPIVVWVSEMYIFSVHALVMVGFDECKYYFNDPWGNIKDLSMNKNDFTQKWDKQTRKAISY